ncbi:hypothetical protein G7085_03905 [Tessaracoccus sp. HDW20]|uniref:hypothetical protein n=1 Tax=Tessaracoccus coleopterorum TaxID=2714950 RepID=UPI0018D29DBD|nr:hypothetical protein [Tessaracoccus coleopterorum]NHB84078.1 hypothetical protein [Tessaracoccus coleopterorum]
MYFGQEHMEMAASWDLSVNEMVNHEYGHHLQKLAGITEAKLALPRAMNWSVAPSCRRPAGRRC